MKQATENRFAKETRFLRYFTIPATLFLIVLIIFSGVDHLQKDQFKLALNDLNWVICLLIDLFLSLNDIHSRKKILILEEKAEEKDRELERMRNSLDLQRETIKAQHEEFRRMRGSSIYEDED